MVAIPATTAVTLDWNSFHNVIDGKLSQTKMTRHGINPANREPNPEVPVSTPADVDAAVAAARAAFKTWSRTPIEDRRKMVGDFADLVLAHKHEFAKLLVKEQGKPLPMAYLEVDVAADIMRSFLELSPPEEVAEEDETKKVIVRYVPLGVVCGIIPWNAPLILQCVKIAPAVLTGNTIIIKPSPYTPYCNIKATELAQQIFPPGVVQALSGEEDLGPWLTGHEGINKISFTGSIPTGMKVMASAAKTLKRVTLELGGNDAAIVCNDVDVQAVAPQLARYAFVNSGQICIAVKRMYIHEDIYDEMRDAIVAFTKTLKVGEGNEPGVVLGPVQNSMQYERVKGFFADIKIQKQKVAIGGEVDEAAKGYFFPPTVIDKPDESSRIVVEEPFGPIVPMLAWSDEDDVIARANNTKTGLGASVWTNDQQRADRISRQLEAGIVWVNEHMQTSRRAALGGHKYSGMGVELGLQGMTSYCNTQAIFMKKAAT